MSPSVAAVSEPSEMNTSRSEPPKTAVPFACEPETPNFRSAGPAHDSTAGTISPAARRAASRCRAFTAYRLRTLLR